MRPSLVKNLHRVASLAESFTEQRPRNCAELADGLDQEGVNLWNISSLVRKCPEDDGRAVVAALRLAAFRLVEAGLEPKPGIESLLHVLQMASKTGATLSELGNIDIAGSVLTSAAKVNILIIFFCTIAHFGFSLKSSCETRQTRMERIVRLERVL